MGLLALFIPLGEYRAMLLDEVLLGLADETRRKILRRLAQGEARVTDLAEPFDISLNSVSKHIRLLERAGLVQRRVVGREHFLSFDPAPLEEAASWIDRQRIAWEKRLDALEAALHAEAATDKAKRRKR